MSNAIAYTRTQRHAAFLMALDYHQRAPEEYAHLTRNEKAAIATTRGSILRTSFRPVRIYTGNAITA